MMTAIASLNSQYYSYVGMNERMPVDCLYGP